MVNASGYGFGDRDVVITRGQTCIVANSCDVTVTRQNRDGTWCFCKLKSPREVLVSRVSSCRNYFSLE